MLQRKPLFKDVNFKEAKLAYKNKNYKKALELFNLSTYDPNICSIRKAECLIRLNDFYNAEKILQSIKKDNLSLTFRNTILAKLAELYLKKYERTNEKNYLIRAGEALKSFNTNARNTELDIFYYQVSLAEYYFQMQEYKNFLNICEGLLKHPKLIDSIEIHLRGLQIHVFQLTNTEKLNKSMDDLFTRLATISKNNIPLAISGYFVLRSTEKGYLKKKNLAPFEYHTKDLLINYRLAHVLSEIDPDNAEKLYTEILRDHKYYWKAYNSFGFFLDISNRSEECIQVLSELIKHDPHCPKKLIQSLNNNEHISNEPISAENLPKKNDYIAAYNTLAITYRNKQNYEMERLCLNAVKNYDSNNVSAAATQAKNYGLNERAKRYNIIHSQDPDRFDQKHPAKNGPTCESKVSVIPDASVSSKIEKIPNKIPECEIKENQSTNHVAKKIKKKNKKKKVVKSQTLLFKVQEPVFEKPETPETKPVSEKSFYPINSSLPEDNKELQLELLKQEVDKRTLSCSRFALFTTLGVSVALSVAATVYNKINSP